MQNNSLPERQSVRAAYVRDAIKALEERLLEFQNFNASSNAPLPTLNFWHIQRPTERAVERVMQEGGGHPPPSS